jgi:hypothetical protein
MNYILNINLNTDGDYCLPFVPAGMTYDGYCCSYSLEKNYKNRDEAIKDAIDICIFLKENIRTSRDYVKESFDLHIDNFVDKLRESEFSVNEWIEEYMYGNYDGTKFIFQAKAHKIDCSFYVTDEEFDLISKNDKHVVRSEIKAAVLSLFTKQE